MIFNKTMKKTLVKLTLTTAIVLFVTGCSSTVTLGPQANKDKYLGATAGTEGASVTLPFVKGEVTPTENDDTSK